MEYVAEGCHEGRQQPSFVHGFVLCICVPCLTRATLVFPFGVADATAILATGSRLISFFCVQAGSLRDMIDQRVLGGGPPLGEVEALVVFAGVCRGVRALHEHKPAWAHRRGNMPHSVN